MGWIDALKLPENDKSWLQRILPRRPKSIWSKINREKATGLIESGLMHSAGLAEIERAKTDGRWESAYDSPSRATIDPEFQAQLDRNPKGEGFLRDSEQDQQVRSLVADPDGEEGRRPGRRGSYIHRDCWRKERSFTR